MNPLVELLTNYSNNPATLVDLRTTLKAVSQDDPSDDEPGLGGVQDRVRRTWAMPDRLTLHGLREVVKLYRSGMTARELADMFAVSLSSIKRILRAGGARKRGKPPG